MLLLMFINAKYRKFNRCLEEIQLLRLYIGSAGKHIILLLVINGENCIRNIHCI